jgi:hypothetical protein
MRFGKIMALATALVVLPLAAAFARGGGGFTWGEQYFDSQLANYDLQATSSGAYGYGVTHGGQRIGGFVMALRSAGSNDFSGGFVGTITGQEARLGPVLAAVELWTGFGGIAPNTTLQTSGTFALMGELDLELGLGFFRGVCLTGYAGMQAFTAFSLDEQPFSNVRYTPVFGVRVAWGSF